MRIIAQAVLVSLCQKQVVTTPKFSCSSPCRNAQKNRSCKCPSIRLSRYVEITCPCCTWRSGSAVQGVRGGSQHASCLWCVVLELRFNPLDARGGIDILGTCLKVWCWPRSVRRRSWPWHKNPIYLALNRAMGPGAVGSLATPYLLSGASRT